MSEENGVSIVEIGVTVRNAWKPIQSVDPDMLSRVEKNESRMVARESGV